MKILIVGFCGKMGQVVYNCAKQFNNIEVVEGFDRKEAIDGYLCQGVKLVSNLDDATESEVVVDFSHSSITDNVIDYCTKTKKPLVLATTGLSANTEDKLKQASKVIPIFRSANMSEGVYALLQIIKQATKMLEGWDIEIVEKHHNQKADAPSGTAKMMLNEVLQIRPKYHGIFGRNQNSGKREPTEIGVHAIRGGGAVGEHEIEFFSENEEIKISHMSYSKQIFAEGALKAAVYIYKKQPGLYGMKNLFE